MRSASPSLCAGSGRDDLRAFPEEVRSRVGGALWEAQLGRKAG
jgi:phage-related protein